MLNGEIFQCRMTCNFSYQIILEMTKLKNKL